MQTRFCLFVACLMALLPWSALAEQAGEPADSEQPEVVEQEQAPEPAAPAKVKKYKVVLLQTLGDDGTSEQIGATYSLLERSIKSLDKLHLVPLSSLTNANQAVPEAVSKQLKQAARDASKAQEHMLNLSLEDAIDAFHSARVGYRRQMAWLDDPEHLIGVLMGLAEALATGGDRQAARQAYREVLAFIPDYEPDPGQVPTKLRSLFEEVREAVAQEMEGQLAAEGTPTGARVIVDGLTVGQMPLLKNLAPGLHMLRVEMPERETFRQVIELNAGEKTTVAPVLKRLDLPEMISALRSRLAAPDKRADSIALARKVAARAGVDAVVLSRLLSTPGQSHPVLTIALVPAGKGKPCLLAASLVAGQEDQTGGALAWQVADSLEEGAPPVAPPASLGVDFTKTLLGRPKALVAPIVVPLPAVGLNPAGPQEPYPGPPGTQPGEKTPPPVQETPIYGKWWFWTGVGAVVLGGVAAGLAVSLSSETKVIYEPDQVRVLVQR